MFNTVLPKLHNILVYFFYFRDVKKKYGVMKFNPNNKVDFTKCDGVMISLQVFT